MRRAVARAGSEVSPCLCSQQCRMTRETSKNSVANSSTAFNFAAALSQECEVPQMHCAQPGCAGAVLHATALSQVVRGVSGALCTAGLCRCGSLVDRTAPVFLAKVLAIPHSRCTLLLQSVENTCLYYCVHSACGLCSAELGPKSYLNRPCSSCNTGCTTNQHRGPFQLSFRRSIIARFSPPPESRLLDEGRMPWMLI